MSPGRTCWGPAKPLQLRHPWENTMQQPPPSPHRESASSCPVKKGKIHVGNLGLINKNASYYICSVYYIYIYHYNIYIYCEGPVQRNHVCWNSKLHFQSGLARTHPPGPKGRGRGGWVSFSCPSHAFRPPFFIWNLNPKPCQTCACRSLSLLGSGELSPGYFSISSSLLASKPSQTAQLTALSGCFNPLVFSGAPPIHFLWFLEVWEERLRGVEDVEEGETRGKEKER